MAITRECFKIIIHILFSEPSLFGFEVHIPVTKNRDSAVGIGTGYGLGDKGVEVGIPVRARIFNSPCCPDGL
jgi:hypothetical protein